MVDPWVGLLIAIAPAFIFLLYKYIRSSSQDKYMDNYIDKLSKREEDFYKALMQKKKDSETSE